MEAIWMILLGIFVFFGAAIVDYADVNNQQAVQDNDAHRAARYSVGMYLVGMAGFVSVLAISPLFIIPECLGLYAGSLVAVRRRIKAQAKVPVVYCELPSIPKATATIHAARDLNVHTKHPTKMFIER